MNYSHDTEHDVEWAREQLRKAKNFDTGLPDVPIRRFTATLRQANSRGPLLPPMDPAVSNDTTLGHALSGLAVHAHSAAQCQRICESVLLLMADRDRVSVHAEFVRLKGIEATLMVATHHRDGAALAALRILDKVSRTSAREIAAAGGIEVATRVCEEEGRLNLPLQEAALRVLHGLTFDSEVRLLLLRRGVKNLAEALMDAGPGGASPEVLTAPLVEGLLQEHVPGVPEAIKVNGQAWEDVCSIINRLVQRLNDGKKGHPRKWELGGTRPLH